MIDRTKVPDATERFWSKVDKSGDCWEWTAYRSTGGYGTINFGRRIITYAHRVSYAITNGPIPDGLQIDHLCRNRGCVNPDHLEAVTPRVNALRSMSLNAQRARQTHCIHGHEFTDENTYRRPDTGGRQCRTCKRRRDREWQRRAA